MSHPFLPRNAHLKSLGFASLLVTHACALSSPNQGRGKNDGDLSRIEQTKALYRSLKVTGSDTDPESTKHIRFFAELYVDHKPEFSQYPAPLQERFADSLAPPSSAFLACLDDSEHQAALLEAIHTAAASIAKNTRASRPNSPAIPFLEQMRAAQDHAALQEVWNSWPAHKADKPVHILRMIASRPGVPDWIQSAATKPSCSEVSEWKLYQATQNASIVRARKTKHFGSQALQLATPTTAQPKDAIVAANKLALLLGVFKRPHRHLRVRIDQALPSLSPQARTHLQALELASWLEYLRTLQTRNPPGIELGTAAAQPEAWLRADWQSLGDMPSRAPAFGVLKIWEQESRRQRGQVRMWIGDIGMRDSDEQHIGQYSRMLAAIAAVLSTGASWMKGTAAEALVPDLSDANAATLAVESRLGTAMCLSNLSAVDANAPPNIQTASGNRAICERLLTGINNVILSEVGARMDAPKAFPKEATMIAYAPFFRWSAWFKALDMPESQVTSALQTLAGGAQKAANTLWKNDASDATPTHRFRNWPTTFRGIFFSLTDYQPLNTKRSLGAAILDAVAPRTF